MFGDYPVVVNFHAFYDIFHIAGCFEPNWPFSECFRADGISRHNVRDHDFTGIDFVKSNEVGDIAIGFGVFEG